MPFNDVETTARRTLEICNACRYCEGLCAVFPAMELRREFGKADLNYLANLCHNCRACYYACPYTPPHEFALNVPRALAEVRNQTYEEYARPRALARLFRANGTVVSVATAIGIAGVLLVVSMATAPGTWLSSRTGPGAFYMVVSEPAMITVAGLTGALSLITLALGVAAFWRDTGGGPSRRISPANIARAARDVFTLRYLGGRGESTDEHGCNDTSDSFSQARRRFHHALFYGVLLCLASTIVAGVYSHYLAWPAPYRFVSLPVLLGTAGGIAMVIGAAGLMWLKASADAAPSVLRLRGADYALLTQLFLAAATGLALLAFRDTRAMGALLAVHLGVVLSFFVIAPYSKFVHAVYRSAALLRYAQEKPRDS